MVGEWLFGFVVHPRVYNMIETEVFTAEAVRTTQIAIVIRKFLIKHSG